MRSTMRPTLTPRSPRNRLRLFLFGVLGYVYLAAVAGVLAGSIVLLLGTRASGLVWIPASLLMLVLLSLIVRIEPVPGRQVRREEAPRLFEMIESVRAALDAPRPRQVILSLDTNAAVLDIPRVGALGARRVLVLGLPLLVALSAEELRAVLAHEFAHLSRRHGWVRARAARLSTAWNNLAFTVQWTRSWYAFLFVPFFRWYAPRFERLVETESRIHELESDRLAADHAGAGVFGRALLRLTVAGAHLERAVWPRIRALSASRGTPPPDIMERLLGDVDGYLSDPRALDWLGTLLSDRSLDEDSHPSLQERLRALGVPATAGHAAELLEVLRHGSGRYAAESLLGGALTQEYAANLSGILATTLAGPWRQWHVDSRLAREADALAGETGRAAGSALWARARWAAVCETPAVAGPLLEAVLDRWPDHKEAQLLLGQLFVDQGTPRQRAAGVAHLEALLSEDSPFALDAAVALRRHYAREGRRLDAQRCQLRQQQIRNAALSGLAELGGLRYGDTLRAYPLPDAARRDLAERLREYPEVESVYLVHKRTRALRSATTLVLAVKTVRPAWYKLETGPGVRRLQEIAGELALPETAALTVEPLLQRRLRKRLQRIPGAEVYRKDTVLEGHTGVDEGWSRPSRLAAALSPPMVVAGSAVAVGLLALAAAVLVPSATPMSLDQLEERVRLEPENAAAKVDLAWALVDVGRMVEALPLAEAAARLQPADPDALYAAGWLLMRQDRFDEAVPYLEGAAEGSPLQALNHHALGWTLANLGRIDEAEGAYRETVRLDPGADRAWYELGLLLAGTDRFPEGEAAIREAMRSNPLAAEYRGGLGALLKGRGRVAEAEALFREGTRIHPEDPRFWVEIGILEHVRGRHEEAIAAFLEAERREADRYEMGLLWRAMLEASREGRLYERED
jgi:tetratricopeptide (TPR) repeat protein/Zn-dependent protease with chaperone function